MIGSSRGGTDPNGLRVAVVERFGRSVIELESSR